MQSLPKSEVVEHPPDILERVRKEYNLEKPGRMEEAVRILREWVQKQPHFKKKDFSDNYLEGTIIGCKGSIERAKAQLDKMCTLRTLLPQFFGPFNPKEDFVLTFEVITVTLLPKLTPDNSRVVIVSVNEKAYKMTDYMNYFRYFIMIAEFLKSHDYYSGLHIIIDYTKTKFSDFFANINLIQIKHTLTILIEGYGVRMRGLHMFTDSKLLDTFVNLLKQFVSPKITSRFHTHTNLEAIHSIVPLEILPKDYGGKEKPIAEITNKLIDLLSAKEFNDFLKEMSQAGTDEACRPANQFNEQYAGVAGTFRHLSVD